MNINIGSIWRFRDLDYTNSFMSRNKDNSIIQDYHPLVVFYNDDYVYYLTAKSLFDRKTNKRRDEFGENITFENGLLDEKHGAIVNCTSINIMKREEFESLFELENQYNNSMISDEKYKRIIEKLVWNIENHNVVFHQAIVFCDEKERINIEFYDKVDIKLKINIKEKIKEIEKMDDFELKRFRRKSMEEKHSYTLKI